MSEARRVRLFAGGAQVVAHTLRPTDGQPDVSEEVRGILESVRQLGDNALVAQAIAYDCPEFSHDRLRVPGRALEDAARTAPAAFVAAVREAAAQVRAVAEALGASDVDLALGHGQRIRVRALPVDSAGVYVPGGRAAYPSSLIMGAVPAQVAGVKRIAIVTPPRPDGRPAGAVMAAAAALGIEEVYATGGPAAIGALAYGTATIAPVAVVVGPGNRWVQEAKRQVAGVVGLDGIAGPSEVMVIADDSADPELVAADLLAQAEHGPDSPAVLASADHALIDAVAEILGRSPDAIGAVTLVECASLPLALDLAEAFAPEHLQLNLRDAAAVAEGVRRAGAVFIGRNGGTAFGDYVAGSNHVLPTGGAARYASALGPGTFTRRMAIVDMPQEAVDALTPHLAALAEVEGFPQHRRSAELRVTP
jgi:histidinol dehydrogenase